MDAVEYQEPQADGSAVSVVWPPRGADAIWTWRAVHLFTTAVKPIFCRLRCEGRENFPLHGGCVVTCNHTMGPDFLVVSYVSPRQIYFMVKAEMMERNRALGNFLRYNGSFSIRRGETDMEAIEHAIHLVKDGKVLGMFPEGTRSRTGKMQKARSGAARIATIAQAPVVPAVVINSEPIFQRANYLSLKPRVEVTIRIGEPLPPPQDPDDSRALRSYIRLISDTMNAMLPEERRTEATRRPNSTEGDKEGVGGEESE